MAGRGSFIESFPLFGYDLDDYDALFAEKLDLLLALRESERVTWSGRLRAPIDDRGVYPRPLQDPLPVWIAVGGTPKILYQHEIFGHDRFLMQLTVGTLPHEVVMRAIELFGTEVAPVVRREVAARRVEAAA
jgi:hypothetical protein